jgi:hypothetical protein
MQKQHVAQCHVILSVQFVTRSAGPCLHRREPSALVLAAATPPLHAGPCCQSELPSFRRWCPTRGLLARSRALWLSFSMLMAGSGCWSSPRTAHWRHVGTTSARRVAPACEDTLRVETKATRCWRRCSKSCTSPESRRVTGPEWCLLGVASQHKKQCFAHTPALTALYQGCRVHRESQAKFSLVCEGVTCVRPQGCPLCWFPLRL